jgi:hypothetical protein
MKATNSQPSTPGTYVEVGPQLQRLQSRVTEDKLYWVYLAPENDSTPGRFRKAGIPSDHVAVVRHLIHPELAEPGSSKDSWMAFSTLISEPSAHARFPADSLRDFQAGSSV